MKRLLIIILILLMAVVTRFYLLGSLPGGLTWDEAAIAYNGFSIIETHRDEWLEKMPVSFRSFGDYKAPLAIYVSSIFTYLFGLNPWAIRLPFALSGVAAVLGIILLTEQIWVLSFEREKNKAFFSSQWAGLVAGGLLVLSPWHTLFSRVGFESGLALTELIWGVYFLIVWKSNQNKKNLLVSSFYLVCAILLLAATFYTYHSAKITVPLLLLGLFYFTHQRGDRIFKAGVQFGLPFLVLLIPFINDSIFGEGLSRAGVTIVAEYGLSFRLLTALLSNILAHISPGFLVLGGTDSLRHSTGVWGVLLPTTFLYWLGGFVLVSKELCTKILSRGRQTRLTFAANLALAWFIFGLLPAMIGMEVPHPNRSLLALPGFILLSVIGLDALLAWVNLFKPKFIKQVMAALVIFQLMFFGLFARTYLTSYQSASSNEFLSGYLEVSQLAWQYLAGDDDRLPVSQVVMTSQYGQPYIFVLLAGQINPMAYHNGALVSFLFPDEVSVNDLSRKNSLIIAKPGSFGLEADRATKIIYDNYGHERFWLFVTDADLIE